jgi:cell division protein FtsB
MEPHVFTTVYLSPMPRAAETPRKPLRRLLLWSLPVIAVVIAYQTLVGPRGVLKIADLRAQKAQILHEIDSLEARKRELLIEKKRLLTDTAYLEKLARKELGMAKPGEKVYRFVEPEKRSADSVSP